MYKTIDNALSYLGKKFDEVIEALNKTQPKIDVNFKDMPPMVLDAKELDGVVNAVDNLRMVTLAQGKKVPPVDTRLDEVIQLLKDLGQQTEKAAAMGIDVSAINDVQTEIAKLAEVIKENKPKMEMGEVKKTNTLIGDLIKQVDKSFSPDVVVDMSELQKITEGLNELGKTISENSKQKDPQLDKVVELLRTISKQKLVVPNTIKIDDKQLRILSNPHMPTFQGNVPASKAICANVAMASADTEYSYTFPQETVAFYIKIRSQNTKLLMAWETGKLPTSGDGAAYFTVPQNGMQSREGLHLGPNDTIYLQSASASQVVEIIVYTS